MDERSERSDLLAALTTEHFVLQTANNSTYSEAAARSTLYVMALSSSLVGIGFVAGSTDLLIPFAAIVLPVVFLLGTSAGASRSGLERGRPSDHVKSHPRTSKVMRWFGRAKWQAFRNVRCWRL